MTSDREGRSSVLAISQNLTRRVLNALWRWTRRVLKTVAVLIGLVLTLLALLQLTEPGRAFVLEHALEQTNAIIPGRVEAKRLGRLSLMGVELWGLEVFDPQGVSRARVEHLAVDLAWTRLIRGEIAVDAVELESARVDLRVDEPGRGLLAAFSEPNEEPEPESPGPPPDIWVQSIRVSDVLVLLPDIEPVGSVDLTLKELEARFALLDGEPDVLLTRLGAWADRGSDRLLSVEADGELARGNRPSRLKLSASSGPVRLDTELEAVLPTQDAWDSQPLNADMTLSGLKAEQLAFVLQDESLQESFLGEIGIRLQAHGSAQKLAASGSVTTAGGELRIEGLHAEGKSFDARFATDEFRLSEVRADLPERVLGLRLEARIDGLPPEPVKASVSLRELRLDKEALPDIDASAVWTGERAEKVSLLVVDGDSKIEADGHYDLSGEAALKLRADLRPALVARLGRLVGQDLDGRVTLNTTATLLSSGVVVVAGGGHVHSLKYRSGTPEAVSVEDLSLKFNAEGKPEQLKGRVEADIEGAQQGDFVLDQARLVAEGNASDLSIQLHAEGGQGQAAAGSPRPQPSKTELDVDLKVARSSGATRVSGSGKGRLQGQPVDFVLGQTEVNDQGGVQTDGIELVVAGQRLKVEGELASVGESDGLHLTFGPVLLSEVPQVMEIDRRLVGEISGSAWVRGSAKLPRVSAKIRGKNLGLKRQPLAGLAWNLEFDAGQGSANSELHLVSSRGLDVALSTDVGFPGGTQYLEHLREAEAQIKLEVKTLESSFFNSYLPPGTLQFDAALGSQIDAKVSLSGLQVDAKSRAELRIFGGKKFVAHHQLEFAEGRLNTGLQTKDAEGEWIDLKVDLDLNRQQLPLSQLAEALSRAATDAQWHTELKLRRRVLPEIAVLSLFLDESELPPFAIEAEASGTHRPGEEPELQLRLDAEQDSGWRVGECEAEGVRLSLSAKHHEQMNEVRITGAQGPRQLLALESAVEAALAPVLAGKSPQLGPVSLSLKTKELELASLPFVCGKARGKMTATASGRDLMGERPELSLQLRGSEFSLGSRHTLSIDLDAQARAGGVTSRLSLEGQGKHRGAGAEAKLKLPWTWRNSVFSIEDEAPLDVRLKLEKLPIAPLLPPRGALSYARGTVDAELKAEGTLRAPLLVGDLQLHDLAFTSTALAQPLRDINGRLSFHGRKIELEHFEAHDREGHVELSGSVDLSDMKDLRGKIAIQATDFPLRQQGQVVAVTNIRADAETKVTPTETRAVLTLHEVDTWLESVSLRSGIALDAHPDFRIDGKVPEGTPEKMKEAQHEAKSTSQDAALDRVVYITIDADERFWVKREDFAVKLSTILETEITEEAVRVQGGVEIDRGYLQLFGKIFELKRESRLRFIGSTPPNPVLELEAEHVTREGTVVAVRITGRADAPVLQFLLDGDAVDAGIAVQELFGGEKSSGESDATTQAQSFVSGLTAGVLATAARRELGAAAPIVMIDPSDKMGEGRVRAGFELDDIVPPFLRPIVTGVYLEGIVARESDGAAEANTQFGALLELYFPKNFFAAGQYGPGTTWSVDVGWQL